MPRRPTHIAQHLKAAATNACGMILRVDDGTGYQTFAYDRLGNVAENIRAIALPFEDSVYNFRMLFEYDSWNRVQRIVYPDSEVVTYNYDLAGNPCCGGFDVLRFAIETSNGCFFMRRSRVSGFQIPICHCCGLQIRNN